MTREEAIKIFNTVLFFGKCDCPKEEIEECFNMAIKALEQEPCEDCISRQAAIDAMCALCNTGETLEENPWRDNPHIDAIIDALDNLQPVTPKTGHWIAVENEEMKTVGYYCSECDLPMETEQRTNFCPNCGIKMAVTQESEG